ncbi:hypothetical protein [Streptomyces sp. NPDC056291]|uniref:hypothetical protein n=1 Tax=Streptomyces sp. NPDC056291 TaxID=3345772 RepID=UPI0035D5755E
MLIAGYNCRPTVRLDGEPMMASRAVWILAHMDPGEAHVLHTCHRGEEGCINIRHLYLGDNDLNVADMVEAGRNVQGEDCWAAVLTEDQVREIRRRYVPGRNRYRRGNLPELIAEFSVSGQTIKDIVHRRTWKHVQ